MTFPWFQTHIVWPCLNMPSPPMTKHITSRSPANNRSLRATISIIKQQSADAERTASKQYRRDTRKQQTLKMSTKPSSPIPDNHQTDAASTEHPTKDANANTNKKTYHPWSHVIQRLGRVNSGSSVGNMVPANNSSISSINNRGWCGHSAQGAT